MKYGLLAAALLLAALICSCASLESLVTVKEGWKTQGAEGGLLVACGKVSVDTVYAWDSVKEEAEALLPLLLAEKGCALAADGEAELKAELCLIEREYMEGWETKRSLAAEVRLFDARQTDAAAAPAMPLAAGRALLSGEKSLSSSKVTEKLMRLALEQALAQL